MNITPYPLPPTDRLQIGLIDAIYSQPLAALGMLPRKGSYSYGRHASETVEGYVSG